MKKILLLFLLGCSTFCFGQKVQYSAAQIREDIQYLHQQLKEKHPNFYLYTSKNQMDAAFTELKTGVENEMTETEVYQHLSRLSATIKDGHTLFFPASASLEYHNAHSLFFPFRLFFDGHQLFVQHNYSSNDQIEAGTEILKINGMEAPKILDFCLERMMRDGNDLNYPLWILNNYFAEYYSYFYGHPETFVMELKNKNGSTQTLTIAALPKSQIRATRMQKYPSTVFARGLNQKEDEGILLKTDPSKSLATLTIRDFDNGILKEVYKQDFKKTVGAAFRQIEQLQIKNLILDLRGNQGGDLENGIFLLSHILNEAFRVVEQFSVVSDPEMEQEQARNKVKSGSGTKIQAPQPTAFKGNLYLLVDGGSFSNSAIVSSAFQYYHRGKIIGEETGGNKSVICGYETVVTLPQSKIAVHIPTRQFVPRDKDHNDGHGVLPDFLVKPTIQNLVSGVDVAMDFVLKLMEK